VGDNATNLSMPVMNYAVRCADCERDRDSILALWQAAFPDVGKHSIKYDWCYGTTPVGEGRLYLLEHGEDATVIGVQGVVPRRWWQHGKVKGAGILADLAVAKYFRSIGPALTLVRRVIEIERNLANAELLYGFPNSKSEALYRRAGYTKLGEITRYARPLRLRYWLSRKGLPTALVTLVSAIADLALQIRVALSATFVSRQWHCVAGTGFDHRFDALWSRVAMQAGPMVPRDSDYLRWRFCNNFAGQVQVMVLETGDGHLDGYVIYTVGENKIVSILDFLAVDSAKALPVLLKSFVHEMSSRGYYGITLEFYGPQPIADVLIHSGFSPRESNPIYVVLSESASGLFQGAPPYFTSSDRDQ
jgi:hypothetical protein